MHKDDLKDFLFDILNEHDTIFTDISLDDETDTITSAIKSRHF